MMIIRQMTASDIVGVYDIACRSLDEEYVEEVFYLFMSSWPSGQLVATDVFGNIVGFLSGSKMSSEKVTIPLFAVDDRYRGKGAGNELLSEFKYRTVMEGRHFIMLEVSETNTNALEFYEKRGFVRTEYLQNFYNNGGNAVRMLCRVHSNA